jgi:hypothetical protein
MDEARLAEDVTHDADHRLDRMLRIGKLDQPWRGPAGTRQRELVAVEPDDEQLRLQRALHVQHGGQAPHRRMLLPAAPLTVALAPVS